jgi:NADH-quinone oxidoreductase subunit E
MAFENVQEILAQNESQKSGIISILQDIQAEYNYLPEDILKHVALKLDIPLIELYSIASFYNSFSLKPRGKHVCSVCLGTACHVRGAMPILEEIERKLDIKPDETTNDQLFTLKTVNCLGACALGPIVVVDQEYHGNITIQKVDEILLKYGVSGDKDNIQEDL